MLNQKIDYEISRQKIETPTNIHVVVTHSEEQSQQLRPALNQAMTALSPPVIFSPSKQMSQLILDPPLLLNFSPVTSPFLAPATPTLPQTACVSGSPTKRPQSSPSPSPPRRHKRFHSLDLPDIPNMCLPYDTTNGQHKSDSSC